MNAQQLKLKTLIYSHTKKAKYLGIDLLFKDLLKLKVLKC